MIDKPSNNMHDNPGKPLKLAFSEEKLRTLIVKKIRSIFIPASVYRIQLNSEFTFKDAEGLVPYFNELGIEALYCSPYFQASPGSMHGYNTTDPNLINQEIGSREEYMEFCDALSRHSIGQIVDIVPNHMGIVGNNNSWWQDILENGQCSLYSRYFDIDWHPIKHELAGKVLLPVLGNFYGRVLENGEIRLMYQNGGFCVTYFSHQFPLDPKAYPVILEDGDGSLRKKMGESNPHYLELLSIITAFNNLPSSSEQLPEKQQERNREKEIAKQRLYTLREISEEIRAFIEEKIRVFNGDKDDPESYVLLDNLLNLQVYRLSYWSVASHEINYRRFFDINELAAIRIEDENIFLHYHELLFHLIREGRINGVRVDHPDGLYDPTVYFRRLQREYLLQMALKEFEENDADRGETEQIDMDSLRESLERLLVDEFISTPAFYVVAEKILGRTETLPENWIIHGTVGYDYLNALNGLFVDRRNDREFSNLYEEFIGHWIDFENLVYNKKKFYCLVYMASEINFLGHRLDLISETNRNFRDFTRNDLTVAISEVIAGFPVYRTYVSPDSVRVSERDEMHIRAAVARARVKTPEIDSTVYDFLQDTLLLRLNIDENSEEMRLYKDFLFRFQQLTGPIMAKGVEDTSFYVYNRLVSLNEVGGDPFYFGYTIRDFHEHNRCRNRRWPCSMMSSSTHDTKRSEDARLRIDVLSEIPGEWKLKINEWAPLNIKFKTVREGIPEPRNNTEYFIYQTLIGAWPDEPLADDTAGPFVERMQEYILKSIREAKIYTNWMKPDAAYEKAVETFMRSLLTQGTGSGFLDSFTAFQKKISMLGKLNSLSALAIKLGSPGVVDIYQGNETWNYRLVDPDNRRPVDYEPRRHLLEELTSVSARENKERNDPNPLRQENIRFIKFLYTMKGLVFRRKNKSIFLSGEYVPVDVSGPGEYHIVAFLCRFGNDLSLTAAGRFFSEWRVDDDYRFDPEFLHGTELVLPEGPEYPSSLRNIFTDEMIEITAHDGMYAIRAIDLFRRTCACILTNVED